MFNLNAGDMYNQIKYNEYSQDLKDRLTKLKEGETVTFKLNNNGFINLVNSNNTSTPIQSYPTQSVPNTDVIEDVNGEMVSIAYIKGFLPATKDGKPSRPNFGNILFEDIANGELILTRKDQGLIDYLRLCNFNRDSVNPNKREPSGMYIFHEVKPALTAKQQYEFQKQVDIAKRLIDDAEGHELKIMQNTFGLASVVKNVEQSDFEIKLKLREIAEVYPERVIKSSTEVSNKLRALIRAAEENNIVEFDETTREWKWFDSKQVITGCAPGADAEDSLLSNLQNSRTAEETLAKIKSGLEKPERQVVRRKKQLEQEAQQEA